MVANFNKLFKILNIFFITFVISNSSNIHSQSREEKIFNRIRPIGSVNLTEGAQLDLSVKPKLGKDAGIKRYKISCYICHDTGASGSPILGDKSAWSARLKKGVDTLHSNAIHGVNAMPAKGGCLNCSDKEIELTVDYMLEKVR